MSHVEPHSEDTDKVIVWDTDEDGILIAGTAIECDNDEGQFDHMLIEPPIREEN